MNLADLTLHRNILGSGTYLRVEQIIEMYIIVLQHNKL